ncbi:MAG: ABC transporter ATP-binding protein [Bacteroidales bacterium]|nr:ABC transporter ATP-binding protein [Methanocorpusculum sp.]MDD3915494.1 ABC transporter ATP-binding protein [Bacteroidales bacterium]
MDNLTNIIETQSLTKNYGKSPGITSVSLNVEVGDIFGFVGPNGAGKSTFIKLILNLIKPTSGTATVFGRDVVKKSYVIKRSLGYAPSDVRFYPGMTAEQILKNTLRFHRKKDYSKIDTICKRLDLDKYKLFRELSLGNKKKVAIAAALIHEPKIIILDEPTSGLDPLIQIRLFEMLEEAAKNGATVFLSSHNLAEIREHCTVTGFIKNGKIINEQRLDTAITNKIIVTITAENLNREILEKLNSEIIIDNNNTVKFSYIGEIPTLLKTLSCIEISDIIIERHSLEGDYLKYYDDEGKL